MAEVSDDVAPATGAEPLPEDIASMFDLKKKKKKKKKPVEDGLSSTEETGVPVHTSSGSAQEFILDPPTYTYQDMLQRAVDLLHQHNPDYSEKRRQTMKPPQLMRGRNGVT